MPEFSSLVNPIYGLSILELVPSERQTLVCKFFVFSRGYKCIIQIKQKINMFIILFLFICVFYMISVP